MRTTTSKLTAAAVAAGFAVGVLGIAGPASAVPGGDTITTFTIEGGTLNVSAPFESDLGTVPAEFGNVIHQLGTVSVVDDRAALDASWVAYASTFGFATGGGTDNERIEAHQVSYYPGFATSTSGTGTFEPGSGVGDMLLPIQAFSHVGGTGRNTAAWDPTISLSFGSQQVAGTYSGVISHSVA